MKSERTPTDISKSTLTHRNVPTHRHAWWRLQLHFVCIWTFVWCDPNWLELSWANVFMIPLFMVSLLCIVILPVLSIWYYLQESDFFSGLAIAIHHTLTLGVLIFTWVQMRS